jgi:hypothetical protein
MDSHYHQHRQSLRYVAKESFTLQHNNNIQLHTRATTHKTTKQQQHITTTQQHTTKYNNDNTIEKQQTTTYHIQQYTTTITYNTIQLCKSNHPRQTLPPTSSVSTASSPIASAMSASVIHVSTRSMIGPTPWRTAIRVTRGIATSTTAIVISTTTIPIILVLVALEWSVFIHWQAQSIIQTHIYIRVLGVNRIRMRVTTAPVTIQSSAADVNWGCLPNAACMRFGSLAVAPGQSKPNEPSLE